MARVFGGVSTDAVVTGLTAHGTLRSYSVWFYRTGAGGGSLGRVFEKRTAGAQVELMFFDGTPRMSYGRNWTNAAQWEFTTDPSANAWHHWVVTYDAGATGNVPIFYLDGSSAGVTTVLAPTGTLATNTDAYVIGNRTNDNARNWAGSLAEFAVWNTLLSSSEVTTIFNGDSRTPLTVQTANLACYYPLEGRAPEPDISAAALAAAAVTGTVVTQGPHGGDPIYLDTSKPDFIYMRKNV